MSANDENVTSAKADRMRLKGKCLPQVCMYVGFFFKGCTGKNRNLAEKLNHTFNTRVLRGCVFNSVCGSSSKLFLAHNIVGFKTIDITLYITITIWALAGYNHMMQKVLKQLLMCAMHLYPTPYYSNTPT